MKSKRTIELGKIGKNDLKKKIETKYSKRAIQVVNDATCMDMLSTYGD